MGFNLKTFLCIYSGLKNRFSENLNVIGPTAFVLALGPHNDNNIRTERHF